MNKKRVTGNNTNNPILFIWAFTNVGYFEIELEIGALLLLIEVGRQTCKMRLSIRLNLNEVGCKEIQHKTIKIPQILASSWREKQNTYKSTL